jgi:hypothetical protein
MSTSLSPLRRYRRIRISGHIYDVAVNVETILAETIVPAVPYVTNTVACPNQGQHKMIRHT